MACPPIIPVILRDTWQRLVLDRDLQNPPVSPEIGDRYIIPSGAQSVWFGKTDWITEWTPEGWAFTPPEAGMVTYIKDEDLYVQFDSSWTAFGSGDHGALTGLADDDHTQYVHNDIARTITAQHDFDTPAAPFTLGVNAQGEKVLGLNADLLDGKGASDFAPAIHSHFHGSLTGLGNDDHSHYALLAGRIGGQTLIGGTDTNDRLILESTSNATKGSTVIPNSLDLKTLAISSNTTLDGSHNIVFASGTITITLPTAKTDRTYYIMNTGTGIVTIATPGSQTINGETEIKLFLQHDAVRLVSDGSNWFILNDSRQPHIAQMTRDAAQTIPTNAVTQIAFDTVQFDPAGIADNANDKFTIKRAGKYYIACHWITPGAIDDGEAAQSRIHVNGTPIQTIQDFSSTTDGNVSPLATLAADLSAGDDIDMRVFHNEGASLNTLTASDQKPRMTIAELR